MAATYPGAIRVFTSKVDLVDTVLADHVNLLQDEVTAVETALGTGLLTSSWSGSFTTPASHTTLTSRLANIESGLAAATSGKADASTAVTLTGSQTLTNKTLTSPSIASIVNTGVLTLPTSTDTLVGRATADTLSNKTLAAPVVTGTGASFAGSTSGSTTVVASSIASGTLTLPATTDTLVGAAAAQTLSNKTITSPTITGASITATGITTTGAQALTARVRQITISTSAPTAGDGTDGDVWMKYTP